MTRKTEVILAIVIIVALALLLFLLLRQPPAEEVKEVIEATPVVDTVDVTPVDPVDIPPSSEVSATTVGRIFVERFGSYSTESGYTNIDDVLPLATASLQRELEDLATEARNEKVGDYYGVSTRIITIKTETSNETEAVFRVTTQRQESFDTPGNTSVRYQDIRVALVKEGDSWLVRSYTWL